MASAELPHETAIRERAALADARGWTPSAGLIERTAAFAAIPADHAERLLHACTNWKGGLAVATSWEATERMPWAVQRSFCLYSAAVEAAATAEREAA